MRGTHVDILLANMEADFEPGDWDFVSPDETAAELRKISGQDFGADTERWIRWFQRNRPDLIFAYEYRETYRDAGAVLGALLGFLALAIAKRYGLDARSWAAVVILIGTIGTGALVGSLWRRTP